MSSYYVKPKRFLLIVLSLLIAELIFMFMVMTLGDGDLFAALIKSLVVFALLYLFYRQKNWARWILMIGLTLFALLCLFAALDDVDLFLIPLAVCYLIAVIAMFTVDKIPPLPSVDAVEPEVVAEPGTFILEDNVYKYPTLLTRYKALLIDGLLLLAVLTLLMVLIDESEHRSTIMIATGLILFLGYEPLLTISSSTIGQRFMKIRVRSFGDPSRPISVWQSYFRFLVKGFLGWLSFLSINFNPQHRAIHDMAGNSVMISVDE